MGKLLLFAAALVLFAPVASSQLVKAVEVPAGSPQDKALDEISASDGAQKLALIDNFNAEYGKGEYAAMALDLYVSYYTDANDFAKVADYAGKILAVDPDNFSAALHLVRAEYQVGNPAGLVDAEEKLSGIIARYKAQTPPAGANPNWQSLHDQALADQQDQIRYAESLMPDALYKVTSPTERAADAERAVAAFPDSSYAAMEETLAALAYQQAQDLPKTIAAAEKTLTFDPNSISMLLLLADHYSANSDQLDKADAYSKKALELLASAKQPAGISDADWHNRVTQQTGLAWTEQGMVLIQKEDYTGAITDLQKAGPLLKSDLPTYARNLYRLGYADAKLKKFPEAKAALSEAATYDTPTKPIALQLLQQVNAAAPSPAKRTGRG
jgi:tetratricopeptide (TPR) repeat protein